MVDTIRTLAALQMLLANNVEGDVSAQDMRDALLSLISQRGQVSEAGNALVTPISDTTSWFEVLTNTPVLSEVSAIGGSPNFDNPSNCRLRYLGQATRAFRIAASISFSSASNNQEFHIRLGKSGTVSAQAEARRKVGAATGSDVGSTAINWLTTLAQNEYVTIYAKNITGAHNITFVSFNLQAVSELT